MEKSGMKSPTMPKEHFERKLSEAPVCGLKYAGKDSMDNPERLLKSTVDLAAYVKKNKMKY